MKKTMIIAFGLSVLLICGCLSQTIQQGKNLSASGIAYTEAVDKLLDVTTDRVIDFDTEELKKTRRGSDLRKMITQKNAALSDVLAEIGKFRSQTKLLKTYFLNLQALSDSPIKDDAGGAVKSLSDSISKLNKELGGKDGKENLTEDEKKEIGALGGFVANTIHPAKIKRALTRDAEIVGIYLVQQENQIKNITETLQDRFLAENDFFREKKVIAPYVDKNHPIPAEWANNRKLWIKTQFVSQQLEISKKAAKELRAVWAEILQGKTDIDSLSVLISDVNEFVTTVQALEAAGDTN